MKLVSVLCWLFTLVPYCAAAVKSRSKGGSGGGGPRNAVVTLVAGESSGYDGGAIALGQSLVTAGSKLHRVILVTPEVSNDRRRMFDHLWEVIEVDDIPCNHKLHPSVTSKTHDLSGAGYQAGLKRFRPTCTKLASWSLVQFDRVLFMDVDTLVVGPIDDILYGFSNASFAAAPDVFPPDNFNSGILVLNPNMETFKKLLKANEEVGSAEGGDQGVLNNGFCPQWNSVGADDKDCGRLPWFFNVQAAHYETYRTLRQMSGLRLPSVIHFVSDGKPWKVLAMDYQQIPFSEENKAKLRAQKSAHILWREAFFTGTKEKNIAPPSTSVLFEDIATNVRSHGALYGEVEFDSDGEASEREGKRGGGSKKKKSTKKKSSSKKRKLRK